MKDAVQHLQTLLPIHDVCYATHGLEVAQQVKANAGQPCPCGFQAVSLDSEGQVLGFDDAVVAAGKLLLQDGGVLGADVVKIVSPRCDLKTFCVLHRVNLAIQKRKLHMDGSIHIVVEVAQVFKDGGAGLRLSQLITDVLKGNALGECAAVNAAHTVRVDGLIRDGSLRRAGLAVTLVLAENSINFFFLGAGELFGLFGLAGCRFSGQWPLPPVPFGIAAQGRRKHCWSDRAFPWDG